MDRHSYRSDIEFISYMKNKYKKIFNMIGRFDHITNISPLFLGLHEFLEIGDGRLYIETSHVCYPDTQILSKSDRITTMVLINNQDEITYLHELGHIVHKRLFNLDNIKFKPLDDIPP